MIKNILYIAHGQQDFCDDSIFCGLRNFLDSYNIDFLLSKCENFGNTDVTVDMRDQKSYYPFKEDWKKTANMLGVYNQNKEYDLVILGSIWKQTQDKFLEIQHTLKPSGKVVVIDGCDNKNGYPDVPIKIPYDYLFRVNTTEENFLPYACPQDLIEMEEENIEFLLNCQLGPTHSNREVTTKIVYNVVSKLNLLDKCKISYWGRSFIGNSNKTLFDQWWSTLSKTKIIVVERGTGYETYRFWEAVSTGNIILVSPNTLYRQNNLILPDNVVFWENYEDLEYKIKKYISMDDLLVISNRKKNKDIIREHHSSVNRLNKIFNKVNFN